MHSACPSTSGAVSSVASKDQAAPASSQRIGAPRRRGVEGPGGAGQLAEDRRAAPAGELLRLQDEDGGAFAEDEAAALGVEGA